MARQGKAGIDYFSHDVDMLQDKKIRLIKAKHGLLGYAIYLRLLEELYRENGYYLQIDEDFNILFCGDNNIELNVYILILNDCIEKKLFCDKKYKKHNILTSERIQRNYISGTERRKEVNFTKEYLLLKPKELYSDKVNVNIESLNVDINSLNANIGTQKKGKESKTNKTTVKETIWALFPSSNGKINSLKYLDGLLKEFNQEQLELSITRYKEDVEIQRANGFKELKYMNGSTFFNGRIHDYIGDDFKLTESVKPKDNFKGRVNFEL